MRSILNGLIDLATLAQYNNNLKLINKLRLCDFDLRYKGQNHRSNISICDPNWAVKLSRL